MQSHCVKDVSQVTQNPRVRLTSANRSIRESSDKETITPARGGRGGWEVTYGPTSGQSVMLKGEATIQPTQISSRPSSQHSQPMRALGRGLEVEDPYGGLVRVCALSLGFVRLCSPIWTTVRQAAPSTGFSRQEFWSGVAIPFSRGTS